MQQIAVYIILVLAIAFLVKKFFFRSKKNKKGCDADCGCA
ncbi:MAG: FeoB-associated Cys-rich membrane protein [Flavobacteriaceae bacterium]|nr:FeoB-associated Cys-rich membrane protein [Flavobacteriaceae bacterium]